MLDRSSELAKLMRKMSGGNVPPTNNIKKIEVAPKQSPNIKPAKKCNSCSRKKKG